MAALRWGAASFAPDAPSQSVSEFAQKDRSMAGEDEAERRALPTMPPEWPTLMDALDLLAERYPIRLQDFREKFILSVRGGKIIRHRIVFNVVPKHQAAEYRLWRLENPGREVALPHGMIRRGNPDRVCISNWSGHGVDWETGTVFVGTGPRVPIMISWADATRWMSLHRTSGWYQTAEAAATAEREKADAAAKAEHDSCSRPALNTATRKMSDETLWEKRLTEIKRKAPNNPVAKDAMRGMLEQHGLKHLPDDAYDRVWVSSSRKSCATAWSASGRRSDKARGINEEIVRKIVSEIDLDNRPAI